MLGYIYKITNKINNKCYIGQTIHNINSRFKEHINASKHNTGCPLIGKAIAKYGEDNFEIELIEEIDSELLDEREMYWIEFYNSNNLDYGYNLTQGGKKVNISVTK